MENDTPNFAAIMDDIFNPNPDRLGPASDASDDDELAVPGDAPAEVWQLRECQRRVLSAIMAGKGYGHAAAAGGVTRKTVYNWANNDPAFKAAMAAWRARMEMHATSEITCAVAAAARTFGRAAATDWRVAAILLRERGLLARKPQGAPNTLQAQLDALPPARRHEIEARIADLIAGKEPEHMPELRALQERMIAEEAAAVPTPAEHLAEKVGEKELA